MLLLGSPTHSRRGAAAHGASTAQVALAWAMQLGYAVIPSSTATRQSASTTASRAVRYWP